MTGSLGGCSSARPIGRTRRSVVGPRTFGRKVRSARNSMAPRLEPARSRAIPRQRPGLCLGAPNFPARRLKSGARSGGAASAMSISYASGARASIFSPRHSPVSLTARRRRSQRRGPSPFRSPIWSRGLVAMDCYSAALSRGRRFASGHVH